MKDTIGLIIGALTGANGRPPLSEIDIKAQFIPSEAEETAEDTRRNLNAAFLLAHQNISPATRAWLESAACERPQKLLTNYAMYPQILDKDAMQVALVSAKLIQAS